jgi:hypothetical protein
MKFTLNHKTILEHVVLNNREIATQIAETPQWKEGGVLEASLIINGIDVPAKELEKVLKQMWDQCKVDSGKKAFEEKVREKAEESLCEKKDSVYNTLLDLQNKIESMESDIKYPWELN